MGFGRKELLWKHGYAWRFEGNGNNLFALQSVDVDWPPRKKEIGDQIKDNR